MKKASNPAADPARVIYARVSSKEQEKEGFSIPAQLKLPREKRRLLNFLLSSQNRDLAGQPLELALEI